MDNASKALIIASEVLIGVLVISLGLYFLRSLSKFGNDTIFRTRELEEVNRYNEPFSKLINAKNMNYDSNDENNLNRPNIGDVVSAMNYARNVNLQTFDNPDEEKVKMKINDKALREYYLDENGRRGKYSDKMFEFLETYSVKVVTSTSNGGQDLRIKPLIINVSNITYDPSGRINGMDIRVSEPNYDY